MDPVKANRPGEGEVRYIFMDAVVIGTTEEAAIEMGVGAEGVDRIPPGMRKGKASPFPAGGWPIVGGAEAGGRMPRDRSAAMRGLSGRGVLLPVDGIGGGTWGN